MSADGSSPQPDSHSEPLQFDVAEGGTANAARLTASGCARCAQPITTAYYEINRAIVCPSCRAAMDSASDSKLRRVLAAVGLGALAALGGSILYFAVAAITGREFGLVAIVVGFMVGKAVQKGSRGRGGWAYQTLAVSLTYLAIVSTYIPLIAKDFQKMPARSARHADPLRSTDTLAIAANDSASPNAAAESPAANVPPDSGFPITQAGTPIADRSASARPPAHLAFGTIVLGIGALVLLAAIIPIAAGFSNIIGLLIIGIAVFEAWKLNRRVAVTVAGPYRVSSSGGERVV
jgi:hypothetical protein